MQPILCRSILGRAIKMWFSLRVSDSSRCSFRFWFLPVWLSLYGFFPASCNLSGGACKWIFCVVEVSETYQKPKQRRHRLQLVSGSLQFHTCSSCTGSVYSTLFAYAHLESFRLAFTIYRNGIHALFSRGNSPRFRTTMEAGTKPNKHIRVAPVSYLCWWRFNSVLIVGFSAGLIEFHADSLFV
jgi:hypothetical protein